MTMDVEHMNRQAEAYASASYPDRVKMAVDENFMPSINFVMTIPGEMANYAHEIRRFVDAMVYKLEKNAHKGKWENLSVDEAFKLLRKEVDELQAEVGGNTTKTLLEAADVANFALMVASIAIERGR